jgi:putative two-component system response regulator
MDVEGARGNVLIVDDEPANLRVLAGILKNDGHLVRPVTRGLAALEAAATDPPDLVLLDIQMPDMTGYEVCARFKTDERLRDIPIVFISGLADVADKVSAFEAGGADYVTKPFYAAEVRARVRVHLGLRQLQRHLSDRNRNLQALVQQQVQDITSAQMATIFALARLAESRDDDTGKHIDRVQSFCHQLASQLFEDRRFPELATLAAVTTLSEASALHDIGKVAMRDSVLAKQGTLAPDEFEEMKSHTIIGGRTLDAVLKKYPGNAFVAIGVDVARFHHEHWDGTGYPEGRRGSSIPLAARIVALADVYDALTSRRCYRAPIDHQQATRQILSASGSHFDPDVVAAFRAQERNFLLTSERMAR